MCFLYLGDIIIIIIIEKYAKVQILKKIFIINIVVIIFVFFSQK